MGCDGSGWNRDRAAKRGRQPWRIGGWRPEIHALRRSSLERSGKKQVGVTGRYGLPPKGCACTAEGPIRLCCSLCCSEVQRRPCRWWLGKARSGVVPWSGAELGNRVDAGAKNLVIAVVDTLIYPTLASRPLVTDCGVVVDTRTLTRFSGIPTDFLKIRIYAHRIRSLRRP